jgi:hypothetical protein
MSFRNNRDLTSNSPESPSKSIIIPRASGTASFLNSPSISLPSTTDYTFSTDNLVTSTISSFVSNKRKSSSNHIGEFYFNWELIYLIFNDLIQHINVLNKKLPLRHFIKESLM